MPVVDRTAPSVLALSTGSLPSWEPEEQNGSVWGAAFRQDNILGSAIARISNFWGEDNAVEHGYNAWDEIKGTQYEDRWDLFVESNNPRYTASIRSQLDMEARDRATLEASGWGGTLARFTANVLDPTLLIPVGGEIIKGAQGAYRIVDVGLRSAIAGGIGTGVQELGLHATQDRRTAEESAYAIGGGIILGGLLGSGVSALLSKAERKAAMDGFDRILEIDGGGGLSAAPVSRSLGLDALSVDGVAAGGIAKATQFISPNLRLNFSPSPIARQVAQELSEGTLYQAGHAEGLTVGASVSRLAGMTERARMATGMQHLTGAYSDMRKAGIKVSFDEFDDAVGRAMRAEDASDNPFVAKAAKALRGSIVEPFFHDGKAVGLYEEGDDVSFAPSYFPRQYRKKVLVAREPEIKAEWQDFMERRIVADYREDVAKHLETQQKFDIEAAALGRAPAKIGKDVAEKLAAIAAKKAAAAREFYDKWEIRNLGENIDPHDPSVLPRFKELAKEIVDDVYDKLTGREYGSSASVAPEYMTPIKRGPVKERTLPIPDWMLEKQGVLENRASEVLGRYARTLAADVELTRKFGDPRLDEPLKRIADDYRVLREGITDPKELAKLQKRQEADQRDLEALRDLIRGTYKAAENGSAFGRIVRATSHFNFVRSLGGVVISSLSDIYRPAMVHGLGSYMSEGVAPLLRNAAAVKLAVNEARLAGTVVDRVLVHRMMSYAGVADPLERGTPIERLMLNMSRGASTWTGLNIWTDAMKGIASVMSQNRILDGSADARTLAFLGIDSGTAKAIRSQFAAHGEVMDGVHVANTERWTDDNAVRAFRAAVGKDVDSIIVTPGVGDLPLMSRTPLGRILLQFRSFMFAAHQRVLLRGLQENKARFVGGMVAMTTLGMLSATLKAWRGGLERKKKFDETAQNPGYLIGEGLDNAGLFTLAFDVANTGERIAQATTGFSFNAIKTPMAIAGRAFAPDAPVNGTSQRFSSRGPASAVLGPTAGLVFEDIPSATMGGVQAIQGKEVSASRKSAAIRLLPYNSFLGMREAVQALTGDSPYTAANENGTPVAAADAM